MHKIHLFRCVAPCCARVFWIIAINHPAVRILVAGPGREDDLIRLLLHRGLRKIVRQQWVLTDIDRWLR